MEIETDRNIEMGREIKEIDRGKKKEIVPEIIQICRKMRW